MIGDTFTFSQLIDSAIKWLIALALDISSSAPQLFLFFLLLVVFISALIVLWLVVGGFKWILGKFVS
jgi:hypothetical protein